MSAQLSVRGAATSTGGEGEKLVWEVCANLWHPVTNPTGYVSLGLAENALMHNELRDYLRTKVLIDDAAKGLTYGDGPTGSKALRKSLSSFFNDYFRPLRTIEPNQLMVTNGVTSTIEHTAWSLANPSDGILLGRPYYRAFIMDMYQRAGVRPVAVSFGTDMDPCGIDCVAAYENALLKSNNAGVKIRALLICHPHNPLGRCYSRDTLIALMKLCQKHNIHFISDEIYALSVWSNTVDALARPPEPFVSALSIDTTDVIDPALVHVLWGTSKDFGANGLRLGVIVSQANEAFLTSCGANALFSSASSLAESAVGQILDDRTFLDGYVKTNQERLSEAYGYAVSKLRQHGIEYKSGVNAAFFLWINLGKSCGTSVETDVIYRKLLEKKVFVVTGDAAGAEEAGWFRLVFSQRKELIDECITRIAQVIEAEKGFGMDKLSI